MISISASIRRKNAIKGTGRDLNLFNDGGLWAHWEAGSRCIDVIASITNHKLFRYLRVTISTPVHGRPLKRSTTQHATKATTAQDDDHCGSLRSHLSTKPVGRHQTAHDKQNEQQTHPSPISPIQSSTLWRLSRPIPAHATSPATHYKPGLSTRSLRVAGVDCENLRSRSRRKERGQARRHERESHPTFASLVGLARIG